MTLRGDDPRSVGAYRLVSRLGAGGMGVVYLGRSVSGRQVAVKMIRPEFAEDDGFRSRFRREVEAARRVSGAFTAPVVDADPEAEQPWLATLFVPGRTLHARVAEDGPLPPGEIRILAAGLAEALRDIHRTGLVHRDLKPANVLLAEDGLRVIDFGISRAVDSDPLTRTGLVVGTPPFMAPEQFRAGEATGPFTDVFALGSVLVFAATGHGPFDATDPFVCGYRVTHEEPDLTGLPDELRELIAPCLSKEPGARPTVGDLLKRTEAAMSGADATVAAVPAAETVPAAGAGTTSTEAAGTESPAQPEARAEVRPGVLRPDVPPDVPPEARPETEITTANASVRESEPVARPGSGTVTGPAAQPVTESAHPATRQSAPPVAEPGPAPRLPAFARAETQAAPAPAPAPASAAAPAVVPVSPSPEPRPAPEQPRGGFPKRRTALALVTLAAVVAGTLWVVNQGGGQDEQAGDKGGGPAGSASPGASLPATPSPSPRTDALGPVPDPPGGFRGWTSRITLDGRSYELGSGSCATVSSGVYCATSYRQAVKLDPATGAERWKKDYPDGHGYIYRGIAGAGRDTVIGWTSVGISRGMSRLTGLATADGGARWAKHYRQFAIPAYDGRNTVFMADAPEGRPTVLRALDAATGKEKWTIDGPSPGTGQALCAGDGVLVTTEAYGESTIAAAYGAESGEELRRTNFAGSLLACEVRAGVIHFLVGEGDDGPRRALRWDLKKPKGTDPDRVDVDGKFRTGTFADDVFYGSDESAAYAYDLRTGKRMWRRPLPEGVGGAAPATAAGNRLLVPVGEGRVAVLNATTGSQLWTAKPKGKTAGGASESRPMTLGGAVYTVALGTDIFAFRLDGKTG
ncbi:PQQ-binding-like beta-propeller repeat protein [Streptomyces sp. NPDC059892]|uniref:protein kinase domain-containing protein n=1 Tax=Streptomyces sp. NPDC059892 TaxID=3346989 RepID=UPI003655A0C8